ncbi:MAG TPA: DNA methyltransferase [Gemmatimonadaceae bacterium]
MTELIWDGKYDEKRRKVAPPRIALPFQTVETVNESAADRDRNLEIFGAGRSSQWRNRLIWGDKKYVLPSLLQEFAGQVDLIYIDPPFHTGANFAYTATIPDHPALDDDETQFVKQPSMLEQKAYRDTWGSDDATSLDKYSAWFHETVALLRELLSETGNLFVHLDWHVGHYAKCILDEVYGTDCFVNEIVWYYYNKLHDSRKRVLPRAHDVIFRYSKAAGRQLHNPLKEEREKPVTKLKYKKVDGEIQNIIGPDGKAVTYISTDRTIDDVWRIRCLQPANKEEKLPFETQKPEDFLARIITMGSNSGGLVLDCFAGSGTTAAVAEKLNRRWITCDLGRFAIHTTRKRLLAIPNVKPFVVQNLGKYERQAWQSAEFGEGAEAATQRYRQFVLELYHAEPVTGYVWLHGNKSGRMIHVGGVDAPVTRADVTGIVTEFKKAMGKGKNAPSRSGVDILGWDFAFELNETAKQDAELAGINIKLVRIPRELLEKKAVEQGDIKFFELAALSVNVKKKAKSVTLELKDFIIPLDDVPEEVRKAVTHWEQWIDYWAVDWDNSDDAFHNEWQSYRTRKDKVIAREASHTYLKAGTYRVVVKVIDILGNDTTKLMQVEVK